jgi:hypothetical protein
MTTILGITLAALVVLTFLIALPIGTWHLVYTIRRKHRLESQADAREYAKLLAEDFHESPKS